VKILYSGSIGRFPVGGHAWIEMQYLLGLRAVGHDVWYLEECGPESWVYNWQTEALTTDLAYPTDYVRACLDTIGFGDRWIYRAGDNAAGMAPAQLLDVCREADLLIVRGAPLPLWRQEYAWPRRRAFIDADPAFTQVNAANGQQDLVETLARCERLFTIGQRLGQPDCTVPTLGRVWHTTRSPIFLPAWPVVSADSATYFTSVMQWKSYRDVVYRGSHYGNKEQEFPRFLDLPLQTTQPLLLALTGAPPDQFEQHGWAVVEGWSTSLTPESYQTFIQQSRAEFGVAKHGYVVSRGGWFSDRSVCYLASGRPVLVQDTGLADWLPVGKGVVTFTTLDEAVQGIEQINADYAGHRTAARRVAEEFFAVERVLPPLLDRAVS
jgi:hypothetical protein